MNKKVTPRDQEALSAYSDGHLKPKEQARLEERIRTDTGLRKAYEDLEQTRQVLRALPAMKAPRSFVLSPDSASVMSPTISGLFPSFRLVSAFATILFLVVTIGDVLNFTNIYTGIQKDQSASQIVAEGETEFVPQMEVAEAPALEVMKVASDEIETEESISGISSPVPTFWELDVAGTQINPEVEENIEVIAEAPLEETGGSDIGRGAVPGDVGESLEPAPLMLQEADGLEAEIPPAEEKEHVLPDDKIQPESDLETVPDVTLEVTEIIDKTPLNVESQSEEILVRPAGNQIPIIRFVEIALGLIALVSGALALIYRRWG